MNISKFLLIDTALVIATIFLLFLFKIGKKFFMLSKIVHKEVFFKKTSMKLPDKVKLVELEKLARLRGSGIKFDSIRGDWKFVSVWKKNNDEEDLVFSSLLRTFSANIEFKEDISVEHSTKFLVITSIQFGIITIEFSGFGCLKGKQPLLPFFFNQIQLKSGSNIFLRRSLQEPKEKEKSIFALITLEENNNLLSARGPNGAVVNWSKD
tara:strand:+ start:292 stop:918 length:627 start_codon:yes stop_codon:yes gene_type:complete